MPDLLSERYVPGVYEAITQAYYSRGLGLPDQIRSRAQNAYAASATLAAGFVGAGVVAGLRDAVRPLQIAGAAAALAFAVTAFLYIRAIATPVKFLSASEASGVHDPDSFVEFVIAQIRTESKDLERRQRDARLMAIVAAMATAATFIPALVLPGMTAERDVILVLTPSAMNAVTSVCPSAAFPLRGVAPASDFDRPVVRIRLSAQYCHQADVEVSLERANVVAMAAAKN